MDSTENKDLRVPLNFRMRRSAITAYDTIAREFGLDRAAVIRAHLAVGARHPQEVRAALEQLVENR